MKTMCSSRWFLPLFALALGGVVFGAQAIGGKVTQIRWTATVF